MQLTICVQTPGDITLVTSDRTPDVACVSQKGLPGLLLRFSTEIINWQGDETEKAAVLHGGLRHQYRHSGSLLLSGHSQPRYSRASQQAARAIYKRFTARCTTQDHWQAWPGCARIGWPTPLGGTPRTIEVRNGFRAARSKAERFSFNRRLPGTPMELGYGLTRLSPPEFTAQHLGLPMSTVCQSGLRK